MDLSNFREEYLKGQLHRKDLAENPFEQFQTWFVVRRTVMAEGVQLSRSRFPEVCT